MQIAARDACGARSGVFRTLTGKTIATPNLIFPADRGAIPHLVGTMVSHICPSDGFGAYYTALESYVPMVSDLAFQESSLASYLYPSCSPLRDAVSIYGLRPAVVSRLYRCSKQAVAAELSNGSVYRVTPADYAAAADRCCPDVLIPIADFQPQSEHVFDTSGSDSPETYLRRRSRRNASYLRMILTSLKQRDAYSVLGLIDNNIDDLLNLDADLSGYVVPFTEFADIRELMKKLPEDKVRLAFSVSSFDQVVECLRHGFDLFESSWVIRMANQGQAFDHLTGSWISLKDDSLIKDLSPICANCQCYSCHEGRHTRAYIRHLFVIDDLLSYTLTTIHNLHQLDAFFARAREAVQAGKLGEFLARYS